MDQLTNAFERHKRQLLFALTATFFWGLLAHAYCFFGNSFSHDSLNEFHGAILGNDIKLTSGRIFVPLYRDLFRSDVTLPWLIGVLSLLWAGLAVFLVLQFFRVESRGMGILIAGIFVANVSYSATAATYIHDLDCYMFSLLCAVGAAYLWKEKKLGWLLGAGMLTVSMGIYQSFLFVAAALVMMDCILSLLNGESFGTVFGKGLKAVAMIVLGGIVYYAGLKISNLLSGIDLHTGEYNSLDLMTGMTPSLLLQLIVGAYADWLYRLLNAYNTYPGILVKAGTAALLAICAVAIGSGVFSKKLSWKEKGLLVVLAALLPLCMNMIYVLTRGGSHDLMVYGIWMTWLLALLLSSWLAKQFKDKVWQWQNWLCMLVAAAILYGNVQFANGMYIKKEMEHEAYLSLMTRVADRMEQFDGYIPGETPVVFVGIPNSINEVMPGFKDYWNVTGMTQPGALFSPEQSRYQTYFDYVLGLPLLQPEPETWLNICRSDFATNLPDFPDKDCMQLYEGVLVVKFSDD